MSDNWTIRYGSTVLEFGAEAGDFPFVSAPEIGAYEVDNDDTGRPRAHGLAFGRDFRRGQSILFDMQIEQLTEALAYSVLDRVASVWQAEEIANTPGAVAELVAKSGRFAVGRPRRFSPDLTWDYAGAINLIADFRLAQPVWFGAENVREVPFVIPTAGGFTAPFVAPIVTTGNGEVASTLRVGGTRSTWGVYTLSGPITNPRIAVGQHVVLGLNRTLAPDDVVVIDTRPWALSVRLNGASIAGDLTAESSLLVEALIPPGQHALTLRGVSAPGTASLTVSALDAYAAP